jgi:hypothetical protein
MTANEKIELVESVFKGRNDAYGAGDSVKEQVTNEVIKAHLMGKRRIGKYPLSPDILDGSGTWWAAADIDENRLDIAVDFMDALEHLKIPCYIERSKSKGFHCWVFFAQPIEAKIARALMGYATEIVERDANFKIKEIFPKQNTIKNADGTFGYGNYIFLPLFGESVKEGKTVFLNPAENFKPFENQWIFLQSIEKIPLDKIKELVEMGELSEEPTPQYFSSPVAAEFYLEKALSAVKAGNRNETGFNLACQLRDLGLTLSEALPYMETFQAQAPQGGEEYSKKEALATLKSVFGREKRKPAVPSCFLRENEMPKSTNFVSTLEEPAEKALPIEEPALPIRDIIPANENSFLREYLAFCEEITDAPPVFSFFCGVSAVGTVLGNQTRVAWGSDFIYPNLWILLIAASTRPRKSSSIGTSKKICYIANEGVMKPLIAEYISEKDAYSALSEEEKEGRKPPSEPTEQIQILADEFSAEGLLTALQASPAGTMVWSEIATALQQMRKNYMAGTREMLTALYDCPYVYERRLKNAHYKIRRPCLSLLAATTLEWFCEAITETDLLGGLLPRFLYIPSKEIMPFLAYPQKADPEKSQRLVNMLIDIYNSADMELIFSDDAKEFFIEWSRENDEKALALPDGVRLAAFYHRLQAILLKLAMIIHQNKFPQTNIINLGTLGQAIRTTEYLRDAATYMVRGQLTFSQDQATRKRILEIIAREKNEGITKSKLTRMAHIKVKELAEFLDWLMQEGSIQVMKTGKNQERYFAV